MTYPQGAITAILLLMLAAFASERLRTELVAMGGLAVAFMVGLVGPERLFSGFSNPAVITVIEVLLVSAALAQTRLMDGIARRVVASGLGERRVIALLCAIGGAISVFINNIGALAIVFPVATSIAARMAIAPAKVFMPLSFATLLGGMCSLTGTPANLVVNQWMVRETGGALGYFETGTIGFPLLVAGIALVALLGPVLFADAPAAGRTEEGEGGGGGYIVERIVPRASALVGQRLAAWEAAADMTVHAVIRSGAHVFARRADIVLAAGDLVVVEGAYPALLEAEDDGHLARPAAAGDAAGEATLEFIVMPESVLVGSRVEDIALYAARGVEVLGLASRRGRVEGRLGDVQIATGDLVLLAGAREDLRLLAGECGLLMLTPRRRLRPNRRAWLGAVFFALGVLATAFDLVPAEAAFGAVVLAMAASGQLNLRVALQDLNWSAVILLACMIPLGQAVQDTGAARVLADAIAGWLPAGEPVVVALVMLAVAVLLTPFIDNVSAAAVLSPIAAGLATRTGTPVESLLVIVAIGVSIDFVTPFGHHNNAVVMSAGGYRFRDFARLGLPLTALSFALAALLVALGVGRA